jgi:hypothetical protein
MVIVNDKEAAQMEQVYTVVGMWVVWGFVAFVAGIVAILAGAYVRGLYWAISFTAWAARNSAKRDQITRVQLIKNVFYNWNDMAMAKKGSVSYTAPNGTRWSN